MTIFKVIYEWRGLRHDLEDSPGTSHTQRQSFRNRCDGQSNTFRARCALLFDWHDSSSISSGIYSCYEFAAGLLFNSMTTSIHGISFGFYFSLSPSAMGSYLIPLKRTLLA